MTSELASDNVPRRFVDTGLDAVTGAFSYSGQAIAEALLNSGRQVRTLTGHPNRAANDSPIEIRSLDWFGRVT